MLRQSPNRLKRMKPKLSFLALVGLAVCGVAAVAQTTASAGEATPPTTASAQATPTAEAAAPAAAEPGPSGVIIPLVIMDDITLTDAIKSLARQAGLNYMLDPKVSFGQTGPDGKPVPQPSVSVRWENITAQNALTALLGNYNLQMVEDPKSKIARITLKDPAAPDPLVSRVIQLKFTGPSNIVAAIQTGLTDKRSKIVPENRTSQLVVLATEKEMVEVERLVNQLDTQSPQVLIETRLLETTGNPETFKGVDWEGTLHGQRVTFGNVASGSGAISMLPTSPNKSFFSPSTFFLDADGVSLVLDFLNKYSETRVISTPRTVTVNNEPAFIEVGEMYPIVNVQASTANTTGGSQISYSNLTVRLDVTPRISANNTINLKVNPRVVRLGNSYSTKINGEDNKVDSFLKREIETTVNIPSGNTLVMGGLMADSVYQGNSKVPILGDIPILGWAFRNDHKKREKSNLIVFLTPTIIEETDFQPTASDFLKAKVPRGDSVEEDWSFWDSGKPGFEKTPTPPMQNPKDNPHKKTPQEIANDPEVFSDLPAPKE